jgi:hypothetical protein
VSPERARWPLFRRRDTPYAPRVVTFVVEAYLSKSRRLLWRATREERRDAYWLALRAEADPRLDVKVVEIRSDANELRSTAAPLRAPVPGVIPLATRSRRPKLWLACR